jgi:hypothetical protein
MKARGTEGITYPPLYDLLVVGGGINGAGIAAMPPDAASRWRCASSTTWRSTPRRPPAS